MSQSRRAFLVAWTVAVGGPLAIAVWALVPAVEPSVGAWIYHPALWRRELELFVLEVAISLGLGYAFAWARWRGRQTR